MSNAADGMNYAPVGKPNKVVEAGEFKYAVMHMDHGHIFGMCAGLREAGATLVAIYGSNTERAQGLLKNHPQAKMVSDPAEILENPEIKLVATSVIPNQRGPLGCTVMEHGKDFFTDKTPFTEMAHLEQAREVAQRTKRKYMVYYSERLHVECAVHAGDLIKQGAIGRVLHVEGTGPHRLNITSRPDWFFDRKQYGGILCDIGSHQLEQFLFYTGNSEATIQSARIAKNHPDHPGLEDFGDLTVTGANGATGYHRVDWFTPDGLRTWGDGRMIIIGTEGYIELRKYINISMKEKTGDHLYLVNKDGEQHMELKGKVGCPFFGQLILDCINRTEHAMTQAHAFKAGELCLQAQTLAEGQVGVNQ